MSTEDEHHLLHQESTWQIKPRKWEVKLFGWTLISRYQNPWEFRLPSAIRYLLYLLGPRHCSRPVVPCQEELTDHLPVCRPTFTSLGRPEGSVTLTWFGHASCLFSFGDVHVLCDPVFGQRASPVDWLGPVRRRPVPCAPESLPELTAVCLSHNHFDHMDRDTLGRLARRQPGLHFYVPMGDGWWMARYCGIRRDRIHELEWWNSAMLPIDEDGNLEIVFTPASHWSGRNLVDKNRSLWGSFVFRYGGDTVYFAGDTGYQDSVFKRIGCIYGPMKLAAIPIGAYEPRDIFQAQHVSPDEAVKIHQDVKSMKSVGIHWGTFCLSTIEGLLQPPDDLRKAAAAAQLPPDSFITLYPGASVSA